ncbi:unnamed protein product [Dibothriocephalus latus]|uniref:Protein kinase domain-containing protein n=1 Tax=Dibothriocephalus latus TaxID=60516 RepID=A0A3P7L942_DIBLA|nr:unnamed protein product [Dibothriocephalus latus]
MMMTMMMMIIIIIIIIIIHQLLLSPDEGFEREGETTGENVCLFRRGVVFRGILNGQPIAVKKVQKQAETDIRHLRNLRHPNIVRFM